MWNRNNSDCRKVKENYKNLGDMKTIIICHFVRQLAIVEIMNSTA